MRLVRPDPGPQRGGLCAGKPHRHVAGVPQPVPRQPRAPARQLLPAAAAQAGLPVALGRGALHRPAHARHSERGALRARLPGQLPGTAPGTERRPAGAQRLFVDEIPGRPDPGGCDPAPGGGYLLRPGRAAQRFAPRRPGAAGSGAHRPGRDRQPGGLRRPGKPHPAEIPARHQQVPAGARTAAGLGKHLLVCR